MKIKKIQQGGSAPYVLHKHIPSTTPQYPPAPTGGTAEVRDDDDATGILTKELEKEILKGGLNNETRALIKKLKTLEAQHQMTGVTSKDDIYDLMGDVIELKNNKEFYNNSIAKAEKSGGLDEVAVSKEGMIFIEDKNGDLQKTSVDRIKQNPRLGNVLTVAEVMEKRNSNPNLIFRNDIFSIANNAIGLNTINSYIEKVVDKLGKESTKESSLYSREDLADSLRGLSDEITISGRDPNESEMRGFNLLYKMLGSPSNYNKITEQTQTERNHVNKALNYIWSTLDPRAQNKLKVQASLNNQNPLQLIQDKFIFSSDYSTEFDISPITDPRREGSGTKNSGTKESRKPLTELETFIQNVFYDSSLKMRYNEILDNKSLSAEFPALSMFAQVSAETQETLPPLTLNEFSKTGWDKLIDTSKITFGHVRVKTPDLSNIILDGNSNMWKVIAPKNYDGSVNVGQMESFEDAMQYYEDNKDSLSTTDMQKYFNNRGFVLTVDSEGVKTVTFDNAGGGNIAEFIVTPGYTNAAVKNLVQDNDDPNKGQLNKLDKDMSKHFQGITDEAWTRLIYGKAVNQKPTSKKMLIFKNKNPRLYKGLLWMPLRNNASLTLNAMNKKGMTQEDYTKEEVMHRSQNRSVNTFDHGNIELLNG